MSPRLIASIFGAIAGAARSPAIGRETVAEWAQLLSDLVGTGGAADADLVALRDQIEQMVAEEREPTADEWASLRGRSDSAHETIQGWTPGQ